MAKTTSPPPPPPAPAAAADTLNLDETQAAAASAPPASPPPPPPAAPAAPAIALGASFVSGVEQTAQALFQQLVAAIPDAATVDVVKDLVGGLAMVSLHSIGVTAGSPAAADLQQRRAIIMSSLQDLGVVGGVTFDNLAKSAVAKLLTQGADFALQALLPAAIAAV